ncbi:protein HtrL-like [Mytilus californianus]|uniref:protein HtrL-like n=1 Tax=Mytilus californianus TaxID=6549 RepID=UPI0022468E31|nr:protein HtrL-like [Mytilus californianus]
MILGAGYHDNSATLVTAIYDIGRGNWLNWKRSFVTYIQNFSHILKLNTKLVVFCEKSTEKYLRKQYGHLEHSKVVFIVKRFSKIEFERYRQILYNIIETDDFKENNTMLQHPEGFSVEYIILMNNKLSFLKEAIKADIFKSSHFFWIDSGYGHGDENIFQNLKKWTPSKLLSLSKTVTFIQLHDTEMYKEYGLKLHKESIDPAFSGGFFGGHRSALLELYHLYNKMFRSLLLENVVDDDQNILLFCYFEIPRLFNLVKGDWFDAFKLFG